MICLPSHPSFHPLITLSTCEPTLPPVYLPSSLPTLSIFQKSLTQSTTSPSPPPPTTTTITTRALYEIFQKFYPLIQCFSLLVPGKFNKHTNPKWIVKKRCSSWKLIVRGLVWSLGERLSFLRVLLDVFSALGLESRAFSLSVILFHTWWNDDPDFFITVLEIRRIVFFIILWNLHT